MWAVEVCVCVCVCVPTYVLDFMNIQVFDFFLGSINQPDTNIQGCRILYLFMCVKTSMYKAPNKGLGSLNCIHLAVKLC